MEDKDYSTHRSQGGDIRVNGGIHYLEIIEGGTRLAMPKTICVPSTSLLKTGSGATEGVLDKGVLGRPPCYPWAVLMGCEDQRPYSCPDWTLLGVEGKLGDRRFLLM